MQTGGGKGRERQKQKLTRILFNKETIFTWEHGFQKNERGRGRGEKNAVFGMHFLPVTLNVFSLTETLNIFHAGRLVCCAIYFRARGTVALAPRVSVGVCF